MEAIGLVASIITLISAASNAALILERVLGLRGVSLYVLGALNEVTDFKATLTLVQTAVDETQHQLPPAYRVEYNRLLDRAMGCMDAFTKYLRRSILREREEVDGAEKVIELKRRVKWMDVLGRGQAQCQIDAFQQELTSLKLNFVLAMSATNFTPAQTFSAGRVQGHFHEIFLSRSDLLDIGDVLNLAPATELILRGSIDSLRDLLRSQPSAVLTRDSLGNTPLHWAIKMANVDAVDLLLEAGADVHAVAKDTATPLCEAVDSDFESREICLKLLEAGADVDQVICHEGTALAEAVRRNRSVSTIKLLLDAGAHLHGIHGDDPVLIIAASESTSDACETLLLAGANIEARGSRGETAVMVAVGNNNHSVLEKLINLGARLDLELYDGDSIVIIAALHGDIETMRILETARIKGIPVDVKSREAYWYAFDRRYHYCFPKSVLPECVEMVAFQALLDSIVPAEYATLEYEHSEDSDAVHVPGAFPFDTDESDCDIGIPEAREWDDVDGCEEQRDSDDESRITPDDDRSGGEKEMEHASEDEAGSLT
ncbi:hypothetical protein J4E83_009732 [Alternaria metachromatica]|uniref:uncharacterized protein n=1 Tax=Alternaria metachromatica TaxID=283354 RepID=UPI0020C49032|nr:uncharacterized protein J4E83_009732 [Alternaria metachromatica]KAI4606977.1 hypothetical protein J4E83_009732 [Alternaria metachromatica]